MVDEEIDDTALIGVPDYWEKIRRVKWRIAVGAAIGALLGVALVHILPYKYTASLTVSPISLGSSISSNISAAVASFTGVNASANSDQSYVQFQTLLTSSQVADRVAQKHPEIMHKIFEDDWDEEAQKWAPPTGFLPAVMSVPKAILGSPDWRQPDGESLQLFLTRKLVIAQDATTGLVTISYENKDAAFAKHLIDIIYAETDGLVREISLERSKARIEYLTKLLATIQQVDQRSVMTTLLSTEVQNEMIASADRYYSALPIELPIESQIPSSPNPPLIVVALLCLGIALPVGLALFRAGQ